MKWPWSRSQEPIEDRPRTHASARDALQAFQRGVQFGQEGHTDKALLEFETAVRLDPNLAQAHYNRALALRALGRVDEAVSGFSECIRLKPGPASAAALFKRAEALTTLNRLEEAVSSYDAFLELHPDYVKALDDRSVILGILGRHEEAMRDKAAIQRLSGA